MTTKKPTTKKRPPRQVWMVVCNNLPAGACNTVFLRKMDAEAEVRRLESQGPRGMTYGLYRVAGPYALIERVREK